MNKRLLLLVLLPLVTVTTGCGTAIVKQTPIPDCEGRACFTELRGSMAGRGGGIYGIAGITVVGDDGSQQFKPIVDGVMPDRLDTLGPSAITGYATYRASRRHAQAIEHAAENSGPGLILINDNSSAAAALSNAEVGVTQEILQQTLPPVRFGHK